MELQLKTCHPFVCIWVTGDGHTTQKLETNKKLLKISFTQLSSEETGSAKRKMAKASRLKTKGPEDVVNNS